MAKLVDASDSKSDISNNVLVRFQFWAPIQKKSIQIIILPCSLYFSTFVLLLFLTFNFNFMKHLFSKSILTGLSLFTLQAQAQVSNVIPTSYSPIQQTEQAKQIEQPRQGDLPENPASGKCYIKCITRDEFEKRIETIVVQPEYKKLKVISGSSHLVPKQVLVKEASKKLIYIPAVYETVEEIYSSSNSENLKVVPAKFKEDSKTYTISPKYSKWEYKTLKNCPSANKEGCMTACYVEYPSKEMSVPITLLDQDATVVSENVAGKGGTYTKQIVKTPARIEEVEIPAQYAIIKVTEIIKPDSIVEEIVPAVTKTVTVTELIKKGGMAVWEEVDCGIAQGGAMILPILYEYNSSKLTNESTKIIDEKLFSFMTEKPNIRIEIMSHTDARGNAAYNLSLSQKRAQSVVSYLVQKGIDKDRLVARGYGKSRLKNRCDTGVNCSEKEHQENRRTEFSVIQ